MKTEGDGLDVEIALTPEIAFWTKVKIDNEAFIEKYLNEIKLSEMVVQLCAKEIKILEGIEKTKNKDFQDKHKD